MIATPINTVRVGALVAYYPRRTWGLPRVSDPLAAFLHCATFQGSFLWEHGRPFEFLSKLSAAGVARHSVDAESLGLPRLKGA